MTRDEYPPQYRSLMEDTGDRMEEVARGLDDPRDKAVKKVLFTLAWDLKQVARRGTPSEGI